MKNSVVLLSLLLIVSCKKAVSSNEKLADSVIVSEQPSNALKSDSANLKVNNGTLTQNVKSDDELANKNGEMVKLIDGEKLPSSLEFEFTDKIQKLIVKITNYNKNQLNATIVPENNKMNIRFNQIKLEDGTYDGPFGREISYKISGKGEVWLIIGKNLMAEGENTGRFSVRIE